MGLCATEAVWRLRQSQSFGQRLASPSASSDAANSPAFLAPASPMAKVATGTPPGICTIDKQAVEALQRLGLHRHAQHRQRRQRRGHARQMRGAAGAGDDRLQAALLGAARVFVEPLRRAVGGDDSRLVGYAEFVEHSGGHAQRRPIGFAAHDDADEGTLPCHSRFLLFGRLCPGRKEATQYRDIATGNQPRMGYTWPARAIDVKLVRATKG